MSSVLRSSRATKRVLDLVFAVIALVLASPVIALVALLVRLNLGKPVFFRQLRPGRGCKPFVMVKFRTMLDLCDQAGKPLANEARLTRFGLFLRSTSLDELPELWNVLKGDMSLVGPRPLLMEYLPLYTDTQRRRHEVRPGLTGWAQINGRNNLSWQDRFRMDVWYVDNQSTWLDLKILARTVMKVITRQDISQPGAATISRFTGNQPQ